MKSAHHPLLFLSMLPLALCGQSKKPVSESVNNHRNAFNFSYCFAGLGSNMGSMQPTIRIEGTRLIYTREQNSFYGERSKPADTILITYVRTSSIDSIIEIVKDLGDTSIHETNICMMSGGIHYLSVVVNEDTTRFALHNTFHRTALRITAIVNRYLPPDRRIWPTEKDIIDSENCWKLFGTQIDRNNKNGDN